MILLNHSAASTWRVFRDMIVLHWLLMDQRSSSISATSSSSSTRSLWFMMAKNHLRSNTRYPTGYRSRFGEIVLNDDDDHTPSYSILDSTTTTTSMTTIATTTTTSSSCAASKAVYDLRGGASNRRGNRKAKTASLSSSSSSKSSSTEKSLTGAKKVGAAASSSSTGKKVGTITKLIQKYQQILPLTRIYMTMLGLTTLLGLALGDEGAHAFLALDPIRVVRGWELWRPLTAASFLGKPSVSWLMSAYFLFEYGSTLERAYGTAQFLVFLFTEIVVLGVGSALLGQPFFAQSIVTAMLHVLSRSMPYQEVGWLVFRIPYWCLPYGLMLSDVLQTQQPMSALPHVIGILAGHFYFFHKFVWPKKRGGVDWLAAPDFLVQRLDPNARKKKEENGKGGGKNKARTRKGRKLGGK